MIAKQSLKVGKEVWAITHDAPSPSYHRVRITAVGEILHGIEHLENPECSPLKAVPCDKMFSTELEGLIVILSQQRTKWHELVDLKPKIDDQINMYHKLHDETIAKITGISTNSNAIRPPAPTPPPPAQHYCH